MKNAKEQLIDLAALGGCLLSWAVEIILTALALVLLWKWMVS